VRIIELEKRIIALESGSIISTSGGTLLALFASAENGIENLYAKIIHAHEVHTEKLCIKNSTGETCVTREQLDAVIAGSTEISASQDGAIKISDPNGVGEVSAETSTAESIIPKEVIETQPIRIEPSITETATTVESQ
jgi:hypothetical protein